MTVARNEIRASLPWKKSRPKRLGAQSADRPRRLEKWASTTATVPAVAAVAAEATAAASSLQHQTVVAPSIVVLLSIAAAEAKLVSIVCLGGSSVHCFARPQLVSLAVTRLASSRLLVAAAAAS